MIANRQNDYLRFLALLVCGMNTFGSLSDFFCSSSGRFEWLSGAVFFFFFFAIITSSSIMCKADKNIKAAF